MAGFPVLEVFALAVFAFAAGFDDVLNRYHAPSRATTKTSPIIRIGVLLFFSDTLLFIINIIDGVISSLSHGLDLLFVDPLFVHFLKRLLNFRINTVSVEAVSCK
ncbi:MAG: monovalent cation/H(+) antiporter subunit G [Pyrinomonadaceae bacterium]